MSISTIHIRDLAIGYVVRKETKVVADHISADIRSGELTCLLGGNGVGKSTLLRTLSAFQSKLGGQIYILDKEIDAYTDKELSRVIGVVLTERLDVQNLTVRELVALGRSPYTGFWGILTPADEAVVDRAIQWTGIESLAHRMVDTLSDGERQKVMIAKALAQETPIVFLDEPTAFLDYPSKVEIMQLLQRLCRETGKTVFLSTHDLELAMQIADKVWLMGKNQPVQVGTPEDLALHNRYLSFFPCKGLLFDQCEGLFRIVYPCTRSLVLQGSGPYYQMARKALQRNGIGVSDQGTDTLLVRVVEMSGTTRYEVLQNGHIVASVSTVEGLLESVLPLMNLLFQEK